MAYSFQFGNRNEILFVLWDYDTSLKHYRPMPETDVMEVFWSTLAYYHNNSDPNKAKQARKVIWLLVHGVDFRINAVTDWSITWEYEEYGHFEITILDDEAAMLFRLNCV